MRKVEGHAPSVDLATANELVELALDPLGEALSVELDLLGFFFFRERLGWE